MSKGMVVVAGQKCPACGGSGLFDISREGREGRHRCESCCRTWDNNGKLIIHWVDGVNVCRAEMNNSAKGPR